MTLRLSTGLRAAMLNGGVNGGVKGALDGGFIDIYSGPQPVSADTGATGTLLATVSVNAEGGGLHFDTTASGTLAKAAGENWKFTGLAVGTAGWFRFYPKGGSPGAASTAEARFDGSIASSGGDVSLSNVSIAVGSPGTIDGFGFSLPAQ